MKKKTKKPLPKISNIEAISLHPGGVFEQWVRCGKAICKCAPKRGGNLHGAYFYLLFWQNGKQHKRYIKQADVARVRAACEAYRKQRSKQQNQRREARSAQQEFRQLLARMREHEQTIKKANSY